MLQDRSVEGNKINKGEHRRENKERWQGKRCMENCHVI
jgi:hypothetical protein